MPRGNLHQPRLFPRERIHHLVREDERAFHVHYHQHGSPSTSTTPG